MTLSITRFYKMYLYDAIDEGINLLPSEMD